MPVGGNLRISSMPIAIHGRLATQTSENLYAIDPEARSQSEAADILATSNIYEMISIKYWAISTGQLTKLEGVTSFLATLLAKQLS